MGVSFYQYVIRRRLSAAKNLIQAGAGMEEAAEQAGYSDYSTFFRAFKREYGISPLHYKKEVLGSISPNSLPDCGILKHIY